jgi:hypothetical protein
MITYLFLELWIAANELMIYVTGQILETVCWESGELLTSLISFWMKLLADGEKGD